MNIREDLTLSIRAMLGSSLESMLLVVGLALSIGATAAGIAMYEQALREGKATLQQAQYREIVVTPREAGSNMSSAVTERSSENIRLSVDDLAAAETVPAVNYAYVAASTRLRFNNAANASFGFVPQGQQPNNAEQDSIRQPDSQIANDGQPNELNGQRGGQGGQRGQGSDQASSDQPASPDFEFASVENGPIPQLSEAPAYQVSSDFFNAMELRAVQGSLFTEQDIANNSKVLVLGAEIAKALFEDGDVLNRQVASFDSIYTIIGVLEKTNSSYDAYAFMPSVLVSDSTGALAGRGVRNVRLHFSVADAGQLDAAAEQLNYWFQASYEGAQLNFNIPRENAVAAIERSEKIAIITLILALAGLLIASVNVSNILYGRMLRRKKQIGILKALGANNRQIFQLFFNESLIMIVIGSVIGLAIVFGFSSLIVSVTQGDALSLLAVLFGVLLATLVTLGFTLIPALQATKTPAAEAIRVE